MKPIVAVQAGGVFHDQAPSQDVHGHLHQRIGLAEGNNHFREIVVAEAFAGQDADAAPLALLEITMLSSAWVSMSKIFSAI